MPGASAGAPAHHGSPLSTGRAVAPRAWRTPPAWALTALLGCGYLILSPSSPDLAAASYRSYLFAQHGFLLWDNSWYGGHHLPAYSLLAPALGALIGPRVIAAVSMTLATALFAKLIGHSFRGRARSLGALFFALGASVDLLSSRVPFDLGLALGLASLLLARGVLTDLPRAPAAAGRRGAIGVARLTGAAPHWRLTGAVPYWRLAGAALLAVSCAVASPVAGAFLGLAYLACAFAAPRRRAAAALLMLAALAPIGLLALAFPEGGDQPFVASAFYPALLGVLVVLALVPRERRVLRVGTALYALALTGAYVLPSAVGGNADRLGALFAGPVAACLLGGGRLRGRSPSAARARLLLVLAPFLFYWQANAPVADFLSASGNGSVRASYYQPLIGELRALRVGYDARPARIEVVPTAAHWEARFLAPTVMLARGWERQLDTYRNALFYEEGKPLTAARYRAWLGEEAVSYVALPDAKLDYSGRAEARLVRGHTPSYLREIWHSRHWRLYRVLGAAPLAQAPAQLRALGVDSLTLSVPRAGRYTVRVHYTPYWALAAGSGCVARAPGDWTRIEASASGSYRLLIRFSLTRIFESGRRCTGGIH